jgi:UDP-N-acetylmuramoylalanine--D-glutamate ligase
VIPINEYAGQQVSAIASLTAGGASVVAWDDNEEACAAAGEAGAMIMHPSGWNWLSVAALVLSPGIPLNHPQPHEVVTRARSAEVPILGDMELFARAIEDSETKCKVVVVTGTNGKSTTTALIGHLLKMSGISAQIGGNIGIPVLELEPPTDDTVYVLEVSSYQAELTSSLKTDITVLLNITPDHLERHGGFRGYVAAKRRMLDAVKPDGRIIIGVDSLQTQQICTEMTIGMNGRLLPVSVGKVISHGMFVVDGELWDGSGALSEKVLNLNELPTLQGVHNWENAAAAFSCAKVLGAESSRLVSGLMSFPGLPHRMETVAEIENVVFINDSKATNAEAAAKALACFDSIYWIAGGQAKEGGADALTPLMSRVRKAYLIGEAAAEFAVVLGGNVEVIHAATLDRAVEQAAQDAAAHGGRSVVLLSPACASFDQFTDFEERGDVFRDLVLNLETDAIHGSTISGEATAS